MLHLYHIFMLDLCLEIRKEKKEIEILKDLYVLALRDLPKYDHIFFVPREFGYSKDGVRWQDEEAAEAVDKAI